MVGSKNRYSILCSSRSSNSTKATTATVRTEDPPLAFSELKQYEWEDVDFCDPSKREWIRNNVLWWQLDEETDAREMRIREISLQLARLRRRRFVKVAKRVVRKWRAFTAHRKVEKVDESVQGAWLPLHFQLNYLFKLLRGAKEMVDAERDNGEGGLYALGLYQKLKNMHIAVVAAMDQVDLVRVYIFVATLIAPLADTRRARDTRRLLRRSCVPESTISALMLCQTGLLNFKTLWNRFEAACATYSGSSCMGLHGRTLDSGCKEKILHHKAMVMFMPENAEWLLRLTKCTGQDEVGVVMSILGAKVNSTVDALVPQGSTCCTMSYPSVDFFQALLLWAGEYGFNDVHAAMPHEMVDTGMNIRIFDGFVCAPPPPM